MSRNNKRGGGRRRFDAGEKELIVKEDGQEYAQVARMLGNGRIEASCFDGIVRVCHIRGTMRKKVWINAGDIVLVGIRDFQDNKGDVILRYTPDEARKLKARGELPDNLEVDKGDKEGNDEDAMFDFGDL